jgi:hypothetical protein
MRACLVTYRVHPERLSFDDIDDICGLLALSHAAAVAARSQVTSYVFHT